MRNQKLGVNIHQTLVLDGAQSIRDSLYMNVLQPFKTELLKNSAIKDFTFHDLRHIFASHLVMNGVDLSLFLQ